MKKYTQLFATGFLAMVLSLVACGQDSGYPRVEGEASAMDQGEADIPGGGDQPYPLPSPKTGPIKIGVQAGHWKVAELPEELERRRTSTGAQYGTVKEVDLNLKIAQLLVAALTKVGYQAELLPATIPPRYEADLFVSIHADWGSPAARRGWKLSPPWRANQYSQILADSISRAFGASVLPQDRGGVTNSMRGYFGFNYRRHEHALSPYTPAVLVETGFVTNATDRAILRDNPQLVVGLLLKGIQDYLAVYDRTKLAAYVPPVYPWLAAKQGGASLFSSPAIGSAKLRDLSAGAVVFPVGQQGEWYEVFVRGVRKSGWIRAAEFEMASDPNWPLPGEDRSGG